jgi:DNA repair photolyase
MNVICEPKGRAREYSELACNLYRGCTHGCLYCYTPACMRTTGEKWHAQAEPRLNVIKNLEKDAMKLRGDARRVLFCFLSDRRISFIETECKILYQERFTIIHDEEKLMW